MDIDIIGLPGCGKTTLFCALTGRPYQEVVAAGAAADAPVAAVEVPDDRVEALSRLFEPRATTRARITFRDRAGTLLQAGAAELGELRRADALTVVVGAYGAVEPEPLGALQQVMDALVLADYEIAQRRLERLSKEGKGSAREATLLGRLCEVLEQGRPIGDGTLQPADARLLSGFAFLTAKPIFVVANLGEADADLGALEARAEQYGLGYVCLRGAVEAEIALLEAHEQKEFLEDLGVAESARDRFIRAVYGRLQLISFLTAGEDEVRAWSIPAGTTAAAAAGTIHSDLQKGFIRAEVIHWADLVAAGGFRQAKSAGKQRLEGREYVVADGDVLTIRFNV